MADAAGAMTPRSAERASAQSIYARLAAMIGAIVAIYFVLVPVFTRNWTRIAEVYLNPEKPITQIVQPLRTAT